MRRFGTIRILLVEDNPDDVEIARRALRQSEVPHELIVARDGQEALDFLFHEGAYAGATDAVPHLIFLDLNLPRVSGLEVLERLRKSPAFTATPIIILTTSTRAEDIEQGYRLGANTYIQKPPNLLEAIKVLGEYWGRFALLPNAA